MDMGLQSSRDEVFPEVKNDLVSNEIEKENDLIYAQVIFIFDLMTFV